MEGWFDLIYNDQACGRLNLSVQYFPTDALNEHVMELQESYFPLRENNRLILYQDADTPALPQVGQLRQFYFTDVRTLLDSFLIKCDEPFECLVLRQKIVSDH